MISRICEGGFLYQLQLHHGLFGRSYSPVGFRSNDLRDSLRSNFTSVSDITCSDGDGVAMKTSKSGPCGSVIKKSNPNCN